MTPLATFAYGFLGGIILEIASLYFDYRGELAAPAARFRSGPYYLVWFTIAVCGGLVAVSHGVGTPIGAIHIGASTPIIFKGILHQIQQQEALLSANAAVHRLTQPIDRYSAPINESDDGIDIVTERR